MTCGIYKISFGSDHRVYIGQSVNIEHRLKDHERYLNQKSHSNYKLQEVFNSANSIQFEIIEEVRDIKDLNSKEIYWISRYDSFNNGLNLTVGGESFGRGEDHPCAKFSNSQILEAVEYLVSKENFSLAYIAEATSIPVSTLQNISRLHTHAWIAETRPDLWAQLVEINKHGRDSAWFKQGRSLASLVSPEGTLYEFADQVAFAREHGLTSDNVSKILRGAVKLHKGWRLPSTELKNYELVSPDGVLYSFTNQSEFAREHNLTVSKVNGLVTGEIKQYKNWRLPGTELKNYELVSPDGVLYSFTNQSEFAREHALIPQSVGQVLQGKLKQHKGWRLPSTILETYKLLSPDNVLHEFSNLTSFAKEHSLDASSIRKVLNGVRAHHKNWTRPR
jgi:group I intron endonuclease